MELLPKHEYLDLRPDTLEAVRRDINMDKPGEMKEAVRILEEWVRQQNHFLKKDFPLPYLETTIVMSKGSLERSKILIDKMCTARTLMPKYFEPYDIKKEFQLIRGSSYFVILPKQTKEYHRIVVAKFIGNYGDHKIRDCIYKYIYSTLDYIKMFDYHSGVICVYDISETDLKDLITSSNLLEIKNCYKTILETYGTRVKRIHVITASKLADMLFNFFKPFLKNKIVDRIVIHKSIEELQQYYYKDLLPKDYGGSEKSLFELQDVCLELLSSEEYRQHMKSISEAKTDETLRPSSQFNDLYAGTYGTFRSLTLD